MALFVLEMCIRDRVWADAFRIPYETKALDNHFRIRKEDYYADNGGVVFPNPNAPTSVYEDLDFVEDILKHNRDVLVIVDEAYIDFGGKSALELIEMCIRDSVWTVHLNHWTAVRLPMVF